MKTYGSKFKSVVAALLLMGAIGCSKTTEHRSTPQGGQDSGGGNTTASTMSDVNFYYARALSQIEYVLQTFLETKTIYKFKDAKKRALLYEVSEKIIKLDTESKSPSLDVGISKLVNASEINIKKTTHCSSVDKVHSFASIKDFKVGSPICLSFSELVQLPKSALEREIVSLLIHEYLHALGYENENQVMVIQNALVQNFDRIFPDGTKFFEERLAPADLTIAAERLKALRKYSRELKYFGEWDYDSDITENDESNWQKLCQILQPVRLSTASLQKEDLQLLTRLGPQLVDTGDLTDLKIDEHLNKADALRFSISQKTRQLEINCRSTLDRISRRTTSPIVGAYVPLKDLQKIIRTLSSEITEFLEVIATTDTYIQKYN